MLSCAITEQNSAPYSVRPERVGRIGGVGEVGVHEVAVGVGAEAVGDGVRAGGAHCVPADLRDAQGVGETPDPSRHPAKGVDVALFGVVEQHLEADADAEERQAVALHAFREGLDQPGVGERIHGGPGRADAGKDDAIGVGELARGGDQPVGKSEPFERVADARGVPRSVVDDRNHPPQATGGVVSGSWTSPRA